MNRSAAQPPSTSNEYTERLWPSWSMICVSAVLVLTLGFAFGYPLGWPIGIFTWLVAQSLVTWLLLRSAGLIVVAGGTLRAGRAHIPLAFVGTATALDRAAATRLRGVEADARAYLFLRPWAPLAVRVDLTDVDDPAPYWYLSSRHPDALAAVLNSAPR